MTTAAGEPLSMMYVRSEQLVFITDLRRYIHDVRFLGPYVFALGRCGSAVEIWSTWNDVRGQMVKDGLVTSFVEAFVLAKDLQSAIEFVKVAYLEGYPLNFSRAHLIASAIEPGQRRIGFELLREMVRQKGSFQGIQTESILSAVLSGQGIGLGSLDSTRSQFVAGLGAELNDMIEMIKGERDVERASMEMDRILRETEEDIV